MLRNPDSADDLVRFYLTAFHFRRPNLQAAVDSVLRSGLTWTKLESFFKIAGGYGVSDASKLVSHHTLALLAAHLG